MKTTTNYALKKPEGTDVVNVQDFNVNSDIIDGKLKELETNEIYYAVATGTANNYAIAVSAITALYDGLAVCAKINIASTGASTININGLGAKAIVDSLGNPITSGGLKANTPYTLRYNGVNFILQGKGGGGNVTADKLLIGTTATGDSGAIVGTMPDNGAINITPGTTAQAIPPGYISGGTVAGDSNLITGNIKAGSTIFGVAGKSSVVDTADGTTTADKILNTYTGYVNGSKVTGTMANNGAVTITPGATAKTIPPGYHNGSGTVATDVNLVTGNILAGKTIFGVTGKSSVVDTSSATALAGQMLGGATAYVNGSKITGSIPSIMGDGNAHYNANNVTGGAYSGDGVNYAYLGVPTGSYLNNVSWIKSPQPHLLPQYIVSGATICGVSGGATVSSLGGKPYSAGTCTMQMLVVTAGDTFTASNQKRLYINVSGLSFTPKIIQVYTSQTWFYFNAVFSDASVTGRQFGLMDSTKGYHGFSASLFSGGFTVDRIYGDYDIVSDTRVPLPWTGTGNYIAIG